MNEKTKKELLFTLTKMTFALATIQMICEQAQKLKKKKIDIEVLLNITNKALNDDSQVEADSEKETL